MSVTMMNAAHPSGFFSRQDVEKQMTFDKRELKRIASKRVEERVIQIIKAYRLDDIIPSAEERFALLGDQSNMDKPSYYDLKIEGEVIEKYQLEGSQP